MVLEFERADRVRDALDGVGLTVGEIVAGIDRPFGAGARVARAQDPVERGIAQVDVAGGHVDLGAQHARAVCKLAGAHAAEVVEVFLYRAVAIGAVPAGLGERAAGGAHLLLRLVVDIGLAGADEMLGPLIELLEIIRRVIKVFAPIEAEPAHVALDGIDIFLLLLGGVGIVEAQVAATAEFLGDAEIEADRLGVADVEVAVRLRREARDHQRVLSRRQIGIDDLTDEVGGARSLGHVVPW